MKEPDFTYRMRLSSIPTRSGLRECIYKTLVGLFLLLAAGSSGFSQQDDSTIVLKWIRLHSGDSLQLDYIYSNNQFAPFVVVLPDRYGVDYSTRHLLKPIAQAGYHVCTFELNSRVGAIDSVYSIDSSDIDRLIQVVVEIRNDDRCTGKVGLLSFDIGAIIGLAAEERFPLFAALTLFYPPDRAGLLRSLRGTRTSVEIHVGAADPLFPKSGMLEFKALLGSKKNRMVFQYYDNVSTMFCNPSHRNFSRDALQQGMDNCAATFAWALH